MILFSLSYLIRNPATPVLEFTSYVSGDLCEYCCIYLEYSEDTFFANEPEKYVEFHRKSGKCGKLRIFFLIRLLCEIVFILWTLKKKIPTGRDSWWLTGLKFKNRLAAVSI